MRVPVLYIIGLVAGLLAGPAVFLALLYLQLGVPTNSSSWAYEIAQRKITIAAAISGPRLLLLGGSNATFGLSARTLEEETGVKTVNMGTYAGWDVDYLLAWIERTARPGDTVLLDLEYQLYVRPLGSEPHDDYILARDPDYFRALSPLGKLDLATRVSFKRIQKGINIWRHGESPRRPHPPYTEGASYLDDYGDETANTAVDPTNPDSVETVAPLLDGISSTRTAGFDQVRGFVEWAKAHGVTVLATFPIVVHRPAYDGANADEAIRMITDFYVSLGVPVVGTARDAMYPPDQFFELPYHLTRAAAIAHTRKLAPELEPYLRK
jgi:hypothetical protein